MEQGYIRIKKSEDNQLEITMKQTPIRQFKLTPWKVFF